MDAEPMATTLKRSRSLASILCGSSSDEKEDALSVPANLSRSSGVEKDELPPTPEQSTSLASNLCGSDGNGADNSHVDEYLDYEYLDYLDVTRYTAGADLPTSGSSTRRPGGSAALSMANQGQLEQAYTRREEPKPIVLSGRHGVIWGYQVRLIGWDRQVLRACIAVVDRILAARSVAFKIGVTTDPDLRYIGYQRQAAQYLVVLHRSDRDTAVFLERGLIAHYRSRTICRNIAQGGEGIAHHAIIYTYACFGGHF